MSDATRTSSITQENEAFALMGRLHVVLRREVGRVIDIKYMAINPQYCSHVLEFARNLGKPDIDTIVDKLEHLYFDVHGLFEFTSTKSNKRPAIALAANAKVSPAPKSIPNKLVAEEAAAMAAILENEEVSNTYVGRLR